MSSSLRRILMPASLALSTATEIIDKTHEFDDAIDLIARIIDKAVEKGKKEVNISCLELNFSDKVKQMWINALVQEGYEVEIVESRTPHVRISWAEPNKPTPRS